MTNDEMRIAIVGACGWQRIEMPIFKSGLEEMSAFGLTGFTKRYWDVRQLPNYPEDLNAMAEAEELLDSQQQFHYAVILGELLNKYGEMASTFDKIHATAAQRAEAFLRTIGKWTETK